MVLTGPSRAPAPNNSGAFWRRCLAKWLNDKNVQVLDPWSGNSPDLNSIENLWGALKKQVNIAETDKY